MKGVRLILNTQISVSVHVPKKTSLEKANTKQNKTIVRGF